MPKKTTTGDDSSGGMPTQALSPNASQLSRDADSALKFSEERLRACIEHTPYVAIQWFDLEGRVVYWNSASEVVFGWSKSEALGKTLDQLIQTPEEADAFLQTLRAINESGKPVGPVEFGFKRRDGTSGFCLSTVFSIPSTSGTPWFVCMDIDITDRRRADEALRESEERLRLALAAANMGTWEWNITTSEVRWSEMVEPIFAIEPGSFNGTHEAYRELIHPDDRDAVLAAITRAVNGEVEEYEVLHRVNGLNDSIQWIRAKGRVYRDHSGKPVRMIGTVMNVTQTQREEIQRIQLMNELESRVKELSLLQEVTRSLMNQSPIGTALVGTDGRWLEVNPALCRIIGYSKEELLGMDIQSLTHPDDLIKDLEQAAELVDGKITEYQMEKRYYHKSGHIIWVQLNTSLVRHTDGTPSHFIGHVQDITHRRQMEEQYRQTQKMESIGHLAGGVAHDFNNILATIMMQTELAAGHPHLPDEVRTFLSDIMASAERAADLTRQLLLFSRKQVIQTRSMDLNDVVTNLIKMLQRVLREDIHIHLNLENAPLHIRADPAMLDQILINLAVNARDAMPDGGMLTFETSREYVTEVVSSAITNLQPGWYAIVRVSDTGIGMEEEIIPHIFDPFFTTKEPGKGTGLGLSTVFGIVRQHQGGIRVFSTPGKGSTFEVLIPLQAAEAEPETDHQPKAVHPAGSETILLVEDDASVRMLTRIMLQRKGYTILEADSGHSAMEVYPAAKQEISLLITDIVMPGTINGLEVARRLRREISGLKVIFTSGYSAEIAGRELELEENQVFIQKPYTSGELLHLVRKLLDAT